jgi:hypothetical protein
MPPPGHAGWMMGTITIRLLAEVPHTAVDVAAWLFDEWGHRYPGRTPEMAVALFRQRANTARLPIAWVALDGERPVGTASLVETEAPDVAARRAVVRSNGNTGEHGQTSQKVYYGKKKPSGSPKIHVAVHILVQQIRRIPPARRIELLRAVRAHPDEVVLPDLVPGAPQQIHALAGQH